MKTNNIKVRFPPSPTGHLHLGNIRTFLFNYLFAKKHGGKILMRFEDTDRQRNKKEYEEEILQTLKKLGLDFDEGPFWQSERTNIYKSYIEKLIESGLAYEAEENQQKTGKVVRIKNPNKEIAFHDLIRGEIKIDTTQYGDFVIARNINEPLYHLTVVVDDIEGEITHIIRGEDHITSTPRQILLYEAFGKMPPTYAHLPLIVGSDNKKLSKRHGAVTFNEFEKMGILPFAFLNYLALLGWSPGNDKEIFKDMQELINLFDLEKVNPSPAKFDYEKLFAINKQHLLILSKEELEKKILENLPDEFLQLFKTFSDIQKNIFLTIIKERIQKLSDVKDVTKQDLNWLIQEKEYDKEYLVWKKSTKENTIKHLKSVKDIIENIKKYTPENLEEKIKSYAQENGMGDVLWPLRFALTEQRKSPDPFSALVLLGKQKSLQRIDKAILLLSK